MATYEQATGKSIETAFKEFHANNPKVHLLFKEQCFRAIRRNKSKISSKQILGFIRWEVSLDIESNDGFKINDAFTSHYSRLFAKEHPEHEDLFNFRELRDSTEDKPPKQLLTFCQRDILNRMYYGGEQLWFINNEYKLIDSHTKVQYKVESRYVEKFIKLKFFTINKTEGNDLFGIIKYSLNEKGKKYLTQGFTP